MRAMIDLAARTGASASDQIVDPWVPGYKGPDRRMATRLSAQSPLNAASRPARAMGPSPTRRGGGKRASQEPVAPQLFKHLFGLLQNGRREGNAERLCRFKI